jgi:BlaI family transcriptional regulator, penicillinase repressor
MVKRNLDELGSRERQIMDTVLSLGEATVGDVLQNLDDPPSYSTVRAQLRILEEKGWLSHHEDGPRYVYKPAFSPRSLRGPALGKLLKSLFGGSRTGLVTALFDDDQPVSKAELDKLDDLVNRLRKERDES